MVDGLDDFLVVAQKSQDNSITNNEIVIDGEYLLIFGNWTKPMRDVSAYIF